MDKTRAKTNMAPPRRWAARGPRPIGRAPFGHWTAAQAPLVRAKCRGMTFSAALRQAGIVAPRVIVGPLNGESLRIYVEQGIAQLKHLLRKAAERTNQAVWQGIRSLLNQFTPQKCKQYNRNAGYASV